MVRDTDPIAEDLTVGGTTPDPETTVEALIRSYNRMPAVADMTDGDMLQWDATAGALIPASGSATYGVTLRAAGRYPVGLPGTLNSEAPADGFLHLMQFESQGGPIDRLIIEVTVAVAASVVRLGIYDEVDGRPTNLLLDGGTVDTSTTGVKNCTVAYTLPAGRVWVGYVAQGGAPTVRAHNVTFNPLVATSGDTGGTQGAKAWRIGGVSGALPATIAPTDGYAHPSIAVRGA